MADLIYLAVIVAFFGIAVLFIRICDRVIGPDVETPDTATEPATPHRRVA